MTLVNDRNQPMHRRQPVSLPPINMEPDFPFQGRGSMFVDRRVTQKEHGEGGNPHW